MEKSEEVNYKKNFCEKYFDKGTWDLDVLAQVDVLLKDKKGNMLLYIESKYKIASESVRRHALAQTILTNKKQKAILSRVALIYRDYLNNDVLELVDCSDNSVMYNNDINWNAEKPSMPTKDAVDRINDRIHGKITQYRNEEIKEFYKLLKNGDETIISISESNYNVVYNQWKNEVKFREEIKDEQEVINLFLVDILNGTKYKKSFISKIDKNEVQNEEPLIREGINLSRYEYGYNQNGEVANIIYSEHQVFVFADLEKRIFFWKKYKRPPEKHEFLKILERSATLYSDKYRRDTGGEYTPTCFVEKQNQILAQHYNLNDFIVFDPCAGVGNLENQFGKDYKHYCYLATLEQMDVDICKIKGFDNAVQYDYLKNPTEQPFFKYKGMQCTITEICQRENRKLMVVMNPPYQRKEGFKNDLAIEFFNKVVKLQPDVIVYYCKTEFFFRESVMNYVNSNYKIVSHIFSNAKDTFQLSEWSVSQIVFDKENGEPIDQFITKADRYDFDNKLGKLNFVKTYTYDQSRPDLIKEIEEKIKEKKGMVLGQWCYLNSVLKISNGGKEKTNKITSKNIMWCLLSKGLNFNTHHRFFEWNYLVYRGNINQVSEELFNDAIMFSLFYIGFLFTNKGQKNYIMPFTAEELGCEQNDLNVLFPDVASNLFSAQEEEKEPPFDFREFLSQFSFSKEAQELYQAALQIFKYYHHSEEYTGKDWNDSFYDITNAIMGKDATQFKALETENDTRIARVKTTKGTKGFGKNTIKYVVPSSALPIFTHFFEVREILARKINRQLVESGLLLWERENIF